MTMKSVSASRVRSLYTVDAQDCDRLALLSTGSLLKWMDAVACMAAERHSQLPSVTVSMDDLVMEHWGVPVGHDVELVAQVNNAFNTSMEVGLTATAEDPWARGGAKTLLCSAFFTFVALGPDGRPLKVPPVVAESVEEKHSFALAAERKALRVKKTCLFDDAHAASEASTRSAALSKDGGAVVGPVSEAVTHLVLPNNANHHGNTFGGFVMECMAALATTVATRQTQRMAAAVAPGCLVAAYQRLWVSSVDAVTFKGASRSGDQIDCSARVTGVFESSMEVEVVVDAYDVPSGERRRINTGFLTLVPFGKRPLDSGSAGSAAAPPSGVPLKLPSVRVAPLPDTSAALARREVRDTMRQLFSSSMEPMAWGPKTRPFLPDMSICNIMGLVRVAASRELKWEPQCSVARGQTPRSLGDTYVGPSPCGVECSVNRNTWGLGLVSVKAVATIHGSSATDVFGLIADLTKRSLWDLVLSAHKVVEVLDEHNSIVHEVFESLGSDKAHDYALLTSWRKMEDGSFVVANRSVVDSRVPPTLALFDRGEILPSGFIIEPSAEPCASSDDDEGSGGGAACTVTYVCQLNPSKLKASAEATAAGACMLLLLNMPRLAALAAAAQEPAPPPSASLPAAAKPPLLQRQGSKEEKLGVLGALKKRLLKAAQGF